MAHAFSQRLAAGPLLCDGAMGTVLYARCIGPIVQFWLPRLTIKDSASKVALAPAK